MPKKTINGLDSAWEEAGTGPPLVLLHAFPLDRAMWAPQREALAKRFRVITPDFRGFGQSGPAPADSTMELLADDLHALLGELNLERVALGGLSMGGYVALAFFRKYPGAVRALILADTRAQPDSEEARRGRFAAAKLAEEEGVAGLVDSLLPKLLGHTTLRTRPEIVEQVRKMMLAATPDGVARALRGMAVRADSTDLLGRISCPTLVLAGEEDTASPPSEGQQMAGLIPRSRFEVIAAAGHLSNMEQPTRFIAALDSFLSGVNP